MKMSSWAVFAGVLSLTAAIYYSNFNWSLKYVALALLLFWISTIIEEEPESVDANKKMAQLIAKEIHALEEEE